MRIRLIVAAGVVAAAVVGVVAAGASRSAWNRETARRVGELRARAREVESASMADLPAPVTRYFALVLPDDRPEMRSAAVRWEGEFRTAPDAGWSPFTAVQHFTSRPPGFVWDAEIRMMPLVPVLVRDGYGAENGSMQGRIGAIVPVVDEGGSPEMARSALARWLGEAVWFPAALLPGPTVRWEAIDDSTARAIVVDGSVSASAEFRFAPGGEITAMTTLRHRDVDGTPVLTPFEGTYGEYVRMSGVLVPGSAEVAWVLEEGRFPYWRARPVEIGYDLPEPAS